MGTSRPLTIWIPLQPTTPEGGGLAWINGSHLLHKELGLESYVNSPLGADGTNSGWVTHDAISYPDTGSLSKRGGSVTGCSHQRKDVAWDRCEFFQNRTERLTLTQQEIKSVP